MKILSMIYHFFWCMVGNHGWTSDAQEGIKPSQKHMEGLKDNAAGALFDYGKMYCKHCGKESKVSIRKRSQHPFK